MRAFSLLSAANLTHDVEKLAGTTAELNFKDMKDKLMKIFGSPDSHSDGGGVPLLKEEAFVADGTDEVLVAQDRGGRFRSGGWKRGGRGRFNQFSKASDSYMNPDY